MLVPRTRSTIEAHTPESVDLTLQNIDVSTGTITAQLDLVRTSSSPGFSKIINDVVSDCITPDHPDDIVYKPVNHVEEKFTHAGAFNCSLSVHRYDTASVLQRIIGSDYYNEFINSSYIASRTSDVSISSIDISNALRKIRPSVENYLPNVNLFEIIGDLKDVKKLLGLFKVDKRHTSVDVVASKHLEVNFGLLPTIGSVVDIFNILTKLDAVVDKWNQFALSKKTMNFHGTIKRTNGSDSYADINPLMGDAVFRDLTYEYKYSYEYLAKLSIYIKPHVIPENMKSSILARAMGFEQPLTGLWELVPFSWMIDYFINVGEIIDQWERDLNSIFKFDVISCGYSEKLTYQGATRYGHYAGTELVKVQSGWNTSEGKTFKRVPLPSTIFDTHIVPKTLGWAGGPSTRQASYMLAVGQLRK